MAPNGIVNLFSVRSLFSYGELSCEHTTEQIAGLEALAGVSFDSRLQGLWL